ncbi:glycoside hydrolase family 2 TIM barrel-domain containing protein [Streptomyces sp. NBC_01465]|uniref:glycoside hydrolase family 2 TIM barrel-domain containing protein n=1 Tax=Streptomyces sp. NBC_01465 TaxID=2903878 RepID=UPI002E3676DD|nr:glycoside hydrolase family 2 TIM barrel-domain containing protein [Streptomyces sp. NBC_01465]
MTPPRRTTTPSDSDSARGLLSRRAALKGLAAAGMLTAVGSGGLFLAAPAAAATTAPEIPPLPDTVSGVATPQVPVTSGWRYTTNPPSSFWTVGTDTSAWKQINVPGEPALQGQTVPSGTECAYSVKVTVPADYAGRRVMLRFDGVYNYARLWVNGTLVRSHDGGFTTWYADITSLVTPGQQATVTLGVTDKPTSIAGQSDYAHHIIGGILRDVTLVALPAAYLTRLHADTTFDSSYANATLTVTAAAALLPAGASGKVALTLTAPDGQQVALSPATLTLSDTAPQASVAIPVTAPRKWDAEHPNLYTLKATFQAQGQSQTVTRQIGFRQVKVQGNQLLINGKPVHLLGACHHSITETLGRSTTPAQEEQAARLYKEANCNFIRTSHYPPTPALLEWADRLGLYVEVEAPVCFQYSTVDDSAYTDQYMAQYAEMLERDRSHACVVEWSVGNESGMGTNFAQENTYSHQTDPSRPTVFEDVSQANGGNQTDVYSGHYPTLTNSNGNANQPIQYGEFAHVPCYNTGTLRADPGARDFWGHSIAKHAAKFRTTNGVVGGAIWAAIDEVFHLPSGPVGYGEWGIIDLWRRRKPEFWLTKKAFSPVRIADGVLTGLTPGAAIPVAVTNWYDHTDLAELAISWQIGNRSGTLTGVSIPARQSGTLTVPAGAWSAGDVLQLTFKRSGALVDDYSLWLNTRTTPDFPAAGGTTPTVQDTTGRITVTGVDTPFTVVFDKTTARLVQATADSAQILTGGPDLVISRTVPGEWAGSSASVTTTGGQAVVTLTGRFGPVNTTIKISIDGSGLLTTTYTVANPPTGSPSDIGIRYTLADGTDTLAWQRDAQWTVYPSDHIGRTTGTATKTRASGTDGYRTEPTWPWSQDTHSYFLFGKNSTAHWTNDFRSTKANIRLAKATAGTSGPGAQVESDGSDSVRLEPVEPIVIDDSSSQIVYTGAWTHADASSGYTSGDLFSTESFSNSAGATAELTFTGTGVGLYSALADNLGIVKISIDGAQAATVDLYGPGKAAGTLVFRSTALTYGQHTVKVECTGTKNSASKGTYALVDAFKVVSSIIDDASGQITYTGTWSHGDSSQSWTSGDLGRTESFSRIEGDSATATFRGTGIRVIAPKSYNQGIAKISVDGDTPTQIDLYAATKQFVQTVYEKTGLDDGLHTVTIQVTGTKNASSSDSYVVLDAFDVITADPFTGAVPGVNLVISSKLNYPDLAWGNYTDPAITLPTNYSATAKLRLLG